MTERAHTGVTCDGCGLQDFTGLRHKCTICFDYDLCHNCKVNLVTTKEHESLHPMQTIIPPPSDFEIPSFDNSGLSFTPQSLLSRLGLSDQGLGSFNCPYCAQSGFGEYGLTDHVFSKHTDDNRPVVCPVCAKKLGGDPNYISRDYHGHLELRHRSPDKVSSLFGGRGDQFFESTEESDEKMVIKKKIRKLKTSKPSNDPTALLFQFDKKDSTSSSTKRSSFHFKFGGEEEEEEPLNEEEKKEKEKERILRGIFVQEMIFSTLFEP